VPDVSDEKVLMKWMRLELGKINDGIVAERKPLSLLIAEERPGSVTRGGKEYVYKKDVLMELAKKLPGPIRERLKLPVILYFSADVPDSCMLSDETALRAFQALGELSELREMENGRLWIGKALAFSLVRSYPTAVQIMMR
jgi:uncharacterized protein (UPF0216 family)